MGAGDRWPPYALIAASSGVTLASVLAAGLSGWPLLLIVLSVGVNLLGLFWLFRRSPHRPVEGDSRQAAFLAEQQSFREQQEAFEDLRARTARQLDEHVTRVTDRERNLAERLARFHEILEYPQDDPHRDRTSAELIRLSERDREVNRILEAEAERVYEKIRTNGYMSAGRLDVVAIREELHLLVLKVAQVYSPNSTNPILETSFEQLARAASRICLHALVLLEQLPLNVQQYTLNSLYGYLQKAVQGYGAYQKAAPWLTYLTRSLYAGRVLSASNPITLGAWWLASEVGRKGAQKLVENVVDRQAVAVLHDLVTVVGVEVACIYGKGFRQRDPAWLLGVELVELIVQFPVSRESLREGLRQITALPLRNEYDRVYLYRCLASHRPAGLHLPDPAMLTRQEREQIAAALEKFFADFIHGATPAQILKWRDGFEERFDLRLKLASEGSTKSEQEQVFSGIVSVMTFLTSVAGLSASQAVPLLSRGRLPALLSDREREEFLKQLPDVTAGRPFEPPGLDPTSTVTDAWLHDLTFCVVLRTSVLRLSADDQLENLLTESGAYFRRSAAETRTLIATVWIKALRDAASEPLHSDVDDELAREVLTRRSAHERVSFCYPHVLLRWNAKETASLPGSWLVGFTDAQNGVRRTILLNPRSEHRALWIQVGHLSVERERGLLVDSAVISGGTWQSPPGGSVPLAIVVPGQLGGGRFKSWFRPLLQFSGQAEPPQVSEQQNGVNPKI